MTQPAPDVPGLKAISAVPSRKDRDGFAIFIPGECLKRGSRLWTDAQREQGVWLKGIFLAASEEEEAILEAQREGKAALLVAYTIRRTLAAVADALTITDEETGEEKIAPGPWRAIPALEMRPYWEEIGSQGRTIYTQAYQLAHTPSEAARAVALASFRLVT